MTYEMLERASGEEAWGQVLAFPSVEVPEKDEVRSSYHGEDCSFTARKDDSVQIG